MPSTASKVFIGSPRSGAATPRATSTSTIGASAGLRPKTALILYRRTKGGVDAYVRAVAGATPMQIVEIERQGVMGAFIKDLSKRMEVPTSRIFTILGVPKATAEKKAAAGELVSGSGGQAAIGMIKLLGIAQDMVRNSTAPEAKGFDAAKWLGKWIEQPQAALGGRKAADLIDTPTGVDVVARLLGSIESGAYQ
jgi:putative toxin-antitoxin system antitoxin component (TIGR02293 family)